jgi:hypothetical protein
MGELFAGFCIGVIVGLIFGPDSERELRAHIEGFLAGYKYAKSTRKSPPVPNKGGR